MSARVEYTILELAHRVSTNGYSAGAIQAAEGVLRKLRSPQYQVNGDYPASQKIEYSGIESIEEVGYEVAQNAIFSGAKVFLPLTIDNGEDSLFLDAAVFSLSFPKNNVKTAITGRNGTVKERMGNGDYTISVTGLFIRPNGQFPFEEIETLNRIWRSENQVEVTNELLNRLGITTCIVDGTPALPASQFTNVQEYQFNLISDDPPELELK